MVDMIYVWEMIQTVNGKDQHIIQDVAWSQKQKIYCIFYSVMLC